MVYDPHQAFDAAASVFVTANAGAGKTSLLTNRVLALLLSGVAPSKLLCLTYTHAAASEMAGRILQKLGTWVMADDESLDRELSTLAPGRPSAQKLVFARSLFARVLEAPEGLRIQTIHSFCQSLLRKFPLEAGINPHFSLMDQRTVQTMLKEAAIHLFSRAEDDPRLKSAISAIAGNLHESFFYKLLGEIIKNKRRIDTVLRSHGGKEHALKAPWRLLGMPEGLTESSLIETYISYDDKQRKHLAGICLKLSASDEKTDKTAHQRLALWLEKGPDNPESLRGYINFHIKSDGEKRDKFCNKKTLPDRQDIDFLFTEQERLCRFIAASHSLKTITRSTDVFYVAEGLLSIYEKLKSSQSLMDYDDLILAARDLLQKPDIAPWVLYKLDGGIDHILVDEAQDTSPEQWDIIDALTQEFFAGQGRQTQDRTLFIVGDEKQSIFSFQGAAPQALAEQTAYFTKAIRDAGKTLHQLQLLHSFRSTQEVLTAVDHIFSQEAARHGLMSGSGMLEHIPTRLDHPGLVELWPLSEPVMQGEDISISSKTVLARQIADTIRGWINGGVLLESSGKPVEAGDIMILVRKRTVLVECLVRALKRNHIPVAGHDRMALDDNLAVQDLVALGQFLLLPEDDLTLASLLKSPVFNISEEALFALAWNRGGKSLWQCMAEMPVMQEAYALLRDLRAKADFVSPYELYIDLLDCCGARQRIIGRMGEEYNDAIDEFLGQALLYERSHTPSLQGFIHWLSTSDSEIKRDMEQVRNCVRIMTVHGAKGLQAPIVILPDTVDLPPSNDTLLWYDYEHGALPLWPAPSAQADTVLAALCEQQKQSVLAEYRRLLYVALTRAEDRLYIAGARAKNDPKDTSWYHIVQQGLQPIATAFDTGRGQGWRLGKEPGRAGRAHASTTGSAITTDEARYAFLNRPAPAEPVPSQPLTPSQPAADEPAALSPAHTHDATSVQRGQLIHHLLQYLPCVPDRERQKLAESLAAPYRHSVSEAVVRESIAEVRRLIDEPAYAFLFGTEALCEVPVAGNVMLEGKFFAVCGQIDRLLISDKDVWIVDYKSNRLPPLTPGDIPAAYLRQMALYHLLLKDIYPNKVIRCALLWTINATITALDEATLSSYI